MVYINTIQILCFTACGREGKEIMYKKETIEKMLANANALKEKYMSFDVSDIKLCISKKNDKIGKVMNISLMPVLTCGNCSHCMGYCYDVKACVFRTTVIDARMRNTVLYWKDPNEYFARIRKALKRRKAHKFFRWHVGGEIPNYSYFCEMVQIAKEYPDFYFWTYTKMYWLVNRYCKEHGKDAIPENLCIMFSEWDGMPLNNPYNFPIFTCKLKDGNKNHEPEFFNTLWKCPGNCDVCKAAHRGCMAKESTYADEH